MTVTRPRTRPTIRATTWAILAVAVAGAIVFGWRVLSAPPVQGYWNRGDIDRYLHLFRVRAEVVVGGHTVTFDELVECRPVGNGPAVARRKGRLTLVPQRKNIARTLPDGSAIVLRFLPIYCWRDHGTWFAGHPVPGYMKTPKRVAPSFFWIDSMAAPTRVDLIASQKYLGDKTKPIHLNSFSLALAPFPPSEVLVDTARRQRARDPRLPFLRKHCGRDGQHYCWHGHHLMPLDIADISANPAIAAYLKRVDKTTVRVSPPRGIRGTLSRFARIDYRAWNAIVAGARVENTRREPVDIATLSKTIDSLVPFVCAGSTCRADRAMSGRLVFYRRKEVWSGKVLAWLAFNGKRLQIATMSASTYLFSHDRTILYSVRSGGLADSY